MVGVSTSHSVTTVVTGPSGGAGATEDPPAEPGSRLGRYRVVEELGRGGMGVVLRAYDPELDREVALKRVRADTLHPSAQSRLVREARVMAQLSHPNVVAIYDVDVDPAGRVMIVMEIVQGATLREWLEAQRRSPGEIIDVLCSAGRGLAAAHALGVLHRDFKLENVLLGADGRARVTDFGLARAVTESHSHSSEGGGGSDDSAGSRALELTAAGTVMGTPLYMAPEQLEDGDLDARADQYAFCVALWRALSGEWPFEGRRNALVRAKRRGPPRWPDLPAPRHVVSALRRGLAPEPAARWPDLPALLDELERDPRRRRRAVGAAVLVGMVGAGAWGWHALDRSRKEAACRDAQAQLDEVWNEGRADEVAAAFVATGLTYADDTWARSRARLDAYAQTWKDAAGTVCRGSELAPAAAAAALQCLDEQQARLDALLQRLVDPDATRVQMAAAASASMPPVDICTDPNQLRLRRTDVAAGLEPSERAALRTSLSHAAAARATGDYDSALQEAEVVLGRARAIGSPALAAEAGLAVGRAHAALAAFDEAAEALEAAFFAAGRAGRDDLALEASSDLVNVVGVRAARHDEGERWSRIAQMYVERLGLDEDLRGADLIAGVGALLHVEGDYAGALQKHERALSIREAALGSDHPDVAAALNNIGSEHYSMGHEEEALTYYERALATWETALGSEHPDLATILANVGNVEQARGQYARAREVQERALAIREAAFGPEHPAVADALTNLGIMYDRQGEFDRARSHHERALQIRERSLGEDHPVVGRTLLNLGLARHGLGHYEAAIAAFERAIGILEEALGPDHPSLSAAFGNRGLSFRRLGRFDEAAADFERALAITEKTLGPDHPSVGMGLGNLGLVNQSRRRFADAVPYHERALAIFEKAFGPDHPRVGASLINLGGALDQVGELERAREVYERALAIFERVGPADPSLGLVLDNLGQLHLKREAYADALAVYERALAIREQTETGPAELAKTRFGLAMALWATDGDHGRARKLAQAARADFHSLGDDGKAGEAEVATWLARHK